MSADIKLIEAIETKNLSEVKNLLQNYESIDEISIIDCAMNNFDKKIFRCLISHHSVDLEKIKSYRDYVKSDKCSSLENKVNIANNLAIRMLLLQPESPSNIHVKYLYDLCTVFKDELFSWNNQKMKDITSQYITRGLLEESRVSYAVSIQMYDSKYRIRRRPICGTERKYYDIREQIHPFSFRRHIVRKYYFENINYNSRGNEEIISKFELNDIFYTSVLRYYKTRYLGRLQEKRIAEEAIESKKYNNRILRSAGYVSLGIGLGMATGTVALPALLATTAIITDYFMSVDNPKQKIYEAACDAADIFLSTVIGVTTANIAMYACLTLTGGMIIPSVAAGLTVGLTVGFAAMYAAPKAYFFVDDYINNKEKTTQSLAL
ncbi:MAG: hypothetical protein EOP34_06535 [Rickettsiales bacterium]|nr:MAG: hypothetical protein EOP34_06535 [Rickettsiales bacterium]